jgi:RNA polymerase sigma factor (TIGR02999 family)
VSDVTRILQSIDSGDPKASEELLPLVYEELRRLAAAKMAKERPGQTLQPTALVHEAWLRLIGPSDNASWRGRSHFFAAAAEAMRRILIERARRRLRIRHGGGQERVDLEAAEEVGTESDEHLLAVHEALERLEAGDSVKAQVVKLRFFVGLSDAEVGEALGISARTVERHWAYAKVWLLRMVEGEGE